MAPIRRREPKITLCAWMRSVALRTLASARRTGGWRAAPARLPPGGGAQQLAFLGVRAQPSSEVRGLPRDNVGAEQSAGEGSRDLSEAQRGHQTLIGGIAAVVRCIHRGLAGIVRRCPVQLDEQGRGPAGGSNADLRNGKYPVQLDEQSRSSAGGSNADLLPLVPAVGIEPTLDRCVKAAHHHSARPAWYLCTCSPAASMSATPPASPGCRATWHSALGGALSHLRYEVLVGQRRLERRTSLLSARCSNQLSYCPLIAVAVLRTRQRHMVCSC